MSALARQLANAARSMVQTQHARRETVRREPLVLLSAGFGSLAILMELIGVDEPSRSFLVLTRYVTTSSLLMGQILGAIELMDMSFLALDSVDENLVNEEMTQIGAELSSWPRQVSEWCCRAPCPSAQAADRLLAGIVSTLVQAHESIPDACLSELVRAAASIRGMVQELQTELSSRVSGGRELITASAGSHDFQDFQDAGAIIVPETADMWIWGE